MIPQERQRKAARQFADEWKGRGYEKGDSQKFWLDLLCNIFGVTNFASFITFEDQVKLDHTSFIDGYIADTKVLIEQKSIDKDLRAPIKQSDGSMLTPFQQAKRYITEMPHSQHPRWVITCNFRSFLVYDMEKPTGEPEEILLENFEKEFHRLSFVVSPQSIHLQKELEISKKAGDIIGEIYDAILAQYHDASAPSAATLRSLNMLCVRIVFCLYAEDAGVFGHKSIFGDYLKQFEARDLRRALLDLFQVLDTKPADRDEYLEERLAAFPYVNGGLFTEQDRTIPQLTDDIKQLLVRHASSEFDWSEISPTIFGAIFESTLNPETRRSGGMHYTSIENIHKVIDPLFYDDLRHELDAIKAEKVQKTQQRRAHEFQEKLASLTFLDPACGSGNFLTETYLSLRRLENEAILLQTKGQVQMAFAETNPVRVSIHQFYGIEINDFAVATATTALWIAESQMLRETSHIIDFELDMLPLKSYANIVEGNALRIDWATLVDKNQLNFIIGNPPFVGKSYQSWEQKEDMALVFQGVKNYGNLDFVTCWFKKACDFIQNTNIACAFVATNSICQGIAVPPLWKYLFDNKININFAYRTFKWNSESLDKAAVHCVIIGFSHNLSLSGLTRQSKTKVIYLNEEQSIIAKNINAYLLDAPNIIVDNQLKPLCNVPEMIVGSCPTDGGGFILSPEEYEEFIKKEPNSKKYIKKYIGSEEFINNKVRYCLWLKNCPPNEIKKMKLVMERVKQVQEFRLASKKAQTRKRAETPTLFAEDRYVKAESLIIPMLSSENRRYVPIGFVDENTVVSNLASFVPNANKLLFGFLTSNVCMAWMRTVAGRLETRYRFSASIVYNTFPFPNPSKEQKAKIEGTAQAILDARALYPDCSLADLYDETLMPKELRKAHQANDRAVMEAYGFSPHMSESEVVARLFEMYQQLIENQTNKPK